MRAKLTVPQGDILLLSHLSQSFELRLPYPVSKEIVGVETVDLILIEGRFVKGKVRRSRPTPFQDDHVVHIH